MKINNKATNRIEIILKKKLCKASEFFEEKPFYQNAFNGRKKIGLRQNYDTQNCRKPSSKTLH